MAESTPAPAKGSTARGRRARAKLVRPTRGKIVLALVAPHFGEGIGPTLHAGLLLWLGFSATVGLVANRFSDKPLSAWLIDAGYQLTSVAIMAVVLGAWR